MCHSPWLRTLFSVASGTVNVEAGALKRCCTTRTTITRTYSLLFRGIRLYTLKHESDPYRDRSKTYFLHSKNLVLK
ncbi:hypothetical protein K450DRAFT_226150 [Umbelopsis ramanniana AG]|uniref:Secreted protein n=1 Tax=Umbelopsis ramanniana AG TaxID=1314678 RepID=A0AAD5EGS8_UMBRA|nr:uncharacterized protein K450DRAFT_226150 [Umbelopsis ramanniana AG]KAI8582626.1 hypothetical protein K450DRAFT_226150 [Umbelopsis ramanniana AG]